MEFRENGGGAVDEMGGRVEVTAVGGAGVEKLSGAKLEMLVLLGGFRGRETPKKRMNVVKRGSLHFFCVRK